MKKLLKNFISQKSVPDIRDMLGCIYMHTVVEFYNCIRVVKLICRII